MTLKGEEGDKEIASFPSVSEYYVTILGDIVLVGPEPESQQTKTFTKAAALKGIIEKRMFLQKSENGKYIIGFIDDKTSNIECMRLLFENDPNIQVEAFLISKK